ncbi:MAG: aminoacyl-tRNA hydrolase [Candidatus Magasanikbacteria bacterium]
MKLIVGLGNPGKKYEKTRHNAGFLVLDKLINNEQLTINQTKKLRSEVAKNKNFILAKPQTFMNESGLAVQALVNFYKIKPEDIIVIHDDKDIPLGEYKIQTNRGPAGHNGIKSIIEHLGTQNFRRVRVGIATPEMDKYEDKANFVLEKFSKEELKILNEVMEKIIKLLNG